MKNAEVKSKAAQVISKAANTKAQVTAKATDAKTKSRISKSKVVESEVKAEVTVPAEVEVKVSAKEVIAINEPITETTIPEVEIPEIKVEIPEIKVPEVKVKPVIVIDETKVTEITNTLFNNSKPLTTLELAKELRKLADLGLNAVQVANTAKKSYAYTRKLLTLTTATEKTIKLIEDNKVSAWKVVEALLIVGNTPEIVEGIIDRVIADPATKPVRVNSKSESDFTKAEVEAMLKDQLNNIVAMLVNGDTVDTISNYKYVLSK